MDGTRYSIIHSIQYFKHSDYLISSVSVTQIKWCCAKKNEGAGLVPIQSRFCQLEDLPAHLCFLQKLYEKYERVPISEVLNAALGQFSYVSI